MSDSKEHKTALYDAHRALGAKMVPFAGYLMPLQYSGQIKEHEAVRRGLGLFDLSHMGEFRLRGDRALAFADGLVTNRVLGTSPGQVVYSPMCLPSGGIVDDLLIYHLEDSVLLVVNAANIEKDKAWIREHLPAGVAFEDESESTSLIAVQGPEVEAFLQDMVEVPIDKIPYYGCLTTTVQGRQVVLSRTGYTGEDGFEIYVDNGGAPGLWSEILERGSGRGMEPVGLAARDTLRFEVGYCLYGNDIDETTTPLEAGLGWTVKLAKESFIGLEALQKQKEAGLPRRLVGIQPERDRTIPRVGYELFDGDQAIGKVTSGTFAPSCDRGLGLAYVTASHASPGSSLEIDIRGRRQTAGVVKTPFYTSGSRKAGKKKASA